MFLSLAGVAKGLTPGVCVLGEKAVVELAAVES